MNIRKMKKTPIFLLLLFLFCAFGLMSQPARQELNLSGQSWRVWPDETAPWKEDTLYLPDEVDLQQIKVNSPTCGWKSLYQTGKTASLPVCVEELFSNGKPNWT